MANLSFLQISSMLLLSLHSVELAWTSKAVIHILPPPPSRIMSEFWGRTDCQAVGYQFYVSQVSAKKSVVSNYTDLSERGSSYYFYATIKTEKSFVMLVTQEV